MILVDHQLRDAIRLGNLIMGGDPRVQPASVDLTLDSTLLLCRPEDGDFVYGSVASHPEAAGGWRRSGSHLWTEAQCLGGQYILEPGQFALGSTAETVSLDPRHCAQVHGKSTLGRNGLAVHITAGLIDPGFEGKITLEFANLSPRSLVLQVGQPICQIQVMQLNQPATPYAGHYQHQGGTTVPWS